MEERDKRRVGEQIEPGGRPKAPGRLELLQRFVNSYNHDFPREWDRIGTAERAQAWLREKRLVAAGERVSGVDAAGRTALEPTSVGVDGAVATLLGILHEAQLSGRWSRMKACRQCEYLFFDRSKNRSAAWCAMSICGNRTKNRAYYRRRRSAST